MDCPVAGPVIEQAAEIEDTGPLAVQVELVRQGELVALRDEFIAPGVYALGLVPDGLAVEGGYATGKDDAGIGDALGAGIALELACGLVP